MALVRRDEKGRAELVTNDPWVVLDDDAPVPEKADVIVSLERWTRERELILGRANRVGLRVRGETEPEELAPLLQDIDLVAVEIPVFTDGRAYTLARLLRSRFGYRGELRACGDVLRDQLFYLARVGFNSFQLKPGKDSNAALTAFQDFSATYQPAADHDVPIWRRRSLETSSSES